MKRFIKLVAAITAMIIALNCGMSTVWAAEMASEPIDVSAYTLSSGFEGIK